MISSSSSSSIIIIIINTIIMIIIRRGLLTGRPHDAQPRAALEGVRRAPPVEEHDLGRSMV